MSAQLTPTTAAAFLQRYYSPKFIENSVAQKASRLFSQIKKNPNGGGDSYNFLSVLSDIATGSADFTTAQAMAADSTNTVGSKFNLDWMESNEPCRIKSKVIAQTKHSIAAWAPVLKFANESALRIAAHRFSVALYTRGWGELSQITSVTGSTFIPKVNSQIHRYFIGQQLVFSSAIATATLRSATALTITGIDYSTKIITCSATMASVSAVDDDWAFTKGDRENSATASRLRPVGLRSWLPSENSVTAAGDITIGGVTRSTDTRHYGWRVDASTGSILDKAIDLCQILSSYGNAEKIMMFTSPANYTAISIAMGTDRRYVDVKGAGGIGFRTVEIYADGISCPVIVDKYCDDTTSYILDPGTIELASLGPAPHVDNEDGQKMIKVSDDNSYEIRYCSWSQIAVKNPAACGKLDHVGV